MSADAKPVWYTGIEWTRQIGAPTKQQSKIGYRYLDADPSVFHTPTNAHNPPTSDKESNIPVRHLVQQDLREETSEIQGVITGLEIVNYICRDGTNKM